MLEIIDLSHEIYTGMPVFPGLPEVKISMHVSHEAWDGISGSEVATPAVNRLEMGEHTGTHVDAINHMGRQYWESSIDRMSLSTFYTEGICLDLSYKGPRELIEIADLEHTLLEADLEIKQGDTVLLYTDHYRRAFGGQVGVICPVRAPGSRPARWIARLVNDLVGKYVAVGRHD